MKVLLTHSYFMRYDPKQWSLGRPYPPLGTLIAAAVLREAGHEVILFDTQLSNSPDEVLPYLEKYRPDVLVIYDDGFNYLTKMCLTKMREAAFRMQEIAKEFGCTVITSSSDSADHSENYLEEGADFVIRGEAEMALMELLGALQNKLSVQTIEGIAYKSGGTFVSTPKRKVMRELDSLPFPAWDLVDMQAYRNIWMTHNGYFSLNVATTRGCPFKCNWCAKPIYGNRYNSRSPEKVVEEIRFLQTNYHFDHIWFCDDIFGLSPGWVERFAELIAAKNIYLRYQIQSRADLLTDENYVRALANSGCATVWLGAESGSQKILDAMEKGTTVEQIRIATKLLKKHGISPAFFLQFGYPGETIEDIRMTIDLMNELLPDDIGISISYPLPGTKFYENVKAGLQGKQNWSDSDDLALLFQNTYSPEFYRQLHRFVHRNYRKHQGYESLKRILLMPARTKAKDLRRAASTFYYLPVVFSDERRLKKIEHDWR